MKDPDQQIKLTPVAHLLSILGEEGAEVAQCCSKINRFGLHDVNVLKPDGPDNVARLIEELNDLIAVVEMLVDEKIIPHNWINTTSHNAKRMKVRKFMAYAAGKGTL